jgi:hypothetical protein
MARQVRSETFVSTWSSIGEQLAKRDKLSGNQVRSIISDTAEALERKWRTSTARQYNARELRADFADMGEALKLASKFGVLNARAKSLVSAFLNNRPCDDKNFPGLPMVIRQITSLDQKQPRRYVPSSP